MKIVLTGANGFIGAPLVDALCRNHEVFALGRVAPVAPAGASITHVKCDIGVPGALAGVIAAGGLPSSVDAVVHLAVSRNHRDFPTTALDMFEVNVASTAYLLDYARTAKASRFILGSTGSVYNPFHNPPFSESRPLSCGKYFPASKAAAELLSMQYSEFMSVARLRFFVPYGPQQADRLIPDMVRRVRDGKPIVLPPEGDGLVFSPIFVDDAVAVVHKCLSEGWNDTFNVASAESFSLLAAARLVGEELGVEPVVERRGDAAAQTLVPDLGKLGERVDLNAFVTFREGVRRILAAL